MRNGSGVANRNKQDAGRLGGLQTFLRYGSEHFRAMGKRGGRPKLQTLSEVRQLPAPTVNNYKKGERLPNNLKELKGLVKLRITALGGAESE